MKMEIVLDNICDDGLKEYLLSQDGILSVNIKIQDFISKLNIEYSDKITSSIIYKYINLYLNEKYPIVLSFDKNSKNQCKLLKYTVEDMCCEWCYKSLVEKLFDNSYIKSVNSNFDFNEPAFNIEFNIEYNPKLNEEELIKFIQDN